VESAVEQSLEAPVGYPPLRRALTPEDHIAVVLDASFSEPHRLLVPVLDHILQMDVAPANITLLCAESGTSEAWLEELPERLEDVHVEEHDSKDRQKLAYLATTRAGRRLYLNRTLVDADQVVVLTERRYDLVQGKGGAEGSLYPAFGDDVARRELLGDYHLDVPSDESWPTRAEGIEVAWLLGQPFYVQLIASRGDGVAHVVSGASEAVKAAGRLLDTSWKVHVPRRADVVVVGIAGDPRRQTFATLAAAAWSAARIVKHQGRIVLLSAIRGELDAGMELVQRAEGPEEALQVLEQTPGVETGAARMWARAVSHARVTVLSAMAGQTIEDLFASPLDEVGQVQRLVSAGGECVFLQDGQRMMAYLD
jgi:nickel-dependent lactate racemase